MNNKIQLFYGIDRIVFYYSISYQLCMIIVFKRDVRLFPGLQDIVYKLRNLLNINYEDTQIYWGIPLLFIRHICCTGDIPKKL